MGIGIGIVNPAVATGGKAVVYQGVSATLDLTLTNNTGGALAFQSGASPSCFKIRMPRVFTAAQVQAMTLTGPAGWTASCSAGDLVLTYTAVGAPQPWAAGATFTASIGGVLALASDPVGPYPITLFPTDMGSNVPMMQQASLEIAAPPASSNLDLTTVLQVALVPQAAVYVSTASAPLSNTLTLSLTNIGTTPLYPGTAAWPTTPQVIVSFVYGDTSGALAPDDDLAAPQVGSAWNILAAVASDQGNLWHVANPTTRGTDPLPAWTLTPQGANLGIIGDTAGADANITFAFSDIVCLTPPGATQMTVLCTGFPGYNDAVYVLDIYKQTPPAAGAIDIWSNVAAVQVTSATQTINIPLFWSMFDVARVEVVGQAPGLTITPLDAPYSTAAPALNYGQGNLVLSGVNQSQSLTVTCFSYDVGGTLLSAPQFTIALEFPPVITSFTGTVGADLCLALTWQTSGATTVTTLWNGEVLDANQTSPFIVRPPFDPTYTITASNGVTKSSPATLQLGWTATAPIPVGSGPVAIAASSDGGSIFVVNQQDGTVSIIDAATQVVTVTIPVGTYPSALAVPPGGDVVLVAVSGNQGDGTVAVIDVATQTVAHTLSIGPQPGDYTIPTVASPDGRVVFLSSVANPSVYMIDVTSLEVTDMALGVALQPSALAVSPDSGSLFVTNRGTYSEGQLLDGVLYIVDITTRAVTATLQLEPINVSITVSPDGAWACVMNMSSVSLIDLAAQLVTTVPMAYGLPSALVFSPDSSLVFVGTISGVVYVVDVATQTMNTVISAGIGTYSICTSPDGASVFVGCDGQVCAIDIATPTTTAIITTAAGGIWGFAALGAQVFALSNYNGAGSVSVLSLLASNS
jgi:YVTN family beta-propeller protein